MFKSSKKLLLHAILSVLLFNVNLPMAQTQDVLFQFEGKRYEKELFLEYCSYMGISFPDLDRKSRMAALNDFAAHVVKYENARDQGIHHLDEILKQKEELEKSHIESVFDYQKVTEEEIKEAYHRLVNQREISHIQVNYGMFSYPADTLEPYRKAMDIHARLQNGEDFNELAAIVSENPKTVKDSGRIGPVSFNSLNYPMEWFTYQTEPGSYSIPVPVWEGYQIVKVHSESPMPGFVEVAHLVKSLTPGDSLRNQAIIHLLDSLRNLALGGSRRFEQLVRGHSDDPVSASMDGNIGLIAPSFIVKELAEAAFDLSYDGEISPVVLTDHSAHLVKRIRRIPLPAFESALDSIAFVLSKNEARADFKKRMFYNWIKHHAEFVSYQKNVTDYLMLGRTGIQQGRWVDPPGSMLDKPLFSIEGRIYTYQDLSNEMKKGRYPYTITNYRPLIWQHYTDFEENILENYLRENLEKIFPETINNIKWAKIDLVVNTFTEQELLQNLSYSQKELESIYRKNRRSYADPENPGEILPFDKAFPMVLADYQKAAIEKWNKELLRENRIKMKGF